MKSIRLLTLAVALLIAAFITAFITAAVQAESLAPAPAYVPPAPTPATLREQASTARAYAQQFRASWPVAAAHFEGRAAAYEDVAAWMEAAAQPVSPRARAQLSPAPVEP